MVITKKLIRAILDGYALHPSGIHGLRHWARVMDNGHRLAKSTGASREVIELFAVFHDACRTRDGSDRGHGLRGAKLARSFRGSLYELPDDQFDLLYAACADHTKGKTAGDATILTCWDADRLDLPRVGITPKPNLLCTDAARTKELIRWSTHRAVMNIISPNLESEWGIEEI